MASGELGKLRMPARPIFGLVFFFLTTLAATRLIGQEPTKKVAAPDASARAESTKLIREVYGREVAAAKTTDQKKVLAEKILQSAKENKNDHVAQFVLLKMSSDLAAQAADCQTAFQALDEMDNVFLVDVLDMKAGVLRKCALMATTIDKHASVAEESAEVSDEAVEKDHLNLAKPLIELALGEARKAKDDSLAKRISERAAEIDGITHVYEAVKKAIATLETAPVDPDANLTVGKYNCFAKGDWQHGLPMLALGNDPTLKALGEEEIRGVASSEEQAKLGDAWWNAAETQKGAEKKQMQGRAGYWYRKALPGLTGLAKDKVASRQQKLQEGLPVYLTDLQAEEVRVAPGKPIAYKGKSSPHNLWAGPPESNSSSHLAYQLDSGFRTMHGDVGICGANQVAFTPITFRIVGDGKTLWTSTPVQKSEISISFRVSVSKVKKLELFVDCPGIYNFAWALWLDPLLER
jgi:NPCBM/NEW2 domain